MPPSAGSHASGELRAFVGIGGNLGDRLATLRSAVHMLAEGVVPNTRVVAGSAVYETRPVGPSKDAFLNAVIELRTELEIEARHGRERRKRWDARTLDLDLLVVLQANGQGGWQELRVDVEGLTLPHPRIGERDFVLVPLADLSGDEAILDGRTAGAWLDAIPEAERTILRRVLEAGELLP